MNVRHHEAAVDHRNAPVESNGQGTIFRGSVSGVVDAAREKRDTLGLRVAKLREILEASPEDHFLLWHDLEAERHAIEDELIEQFVGKAVNGVLGDPLLNAGQVSTAHKTSTGASRPSSTSPTARFSTWPRNL